LKSDDLAGQGRRKFLRWSAMGAAAVPVLASGIAGAAPVDAAPAKTRRLPASIEALKPATGKATPIGDAEYRSRLAKAQRLMTEHRLDAVFIGPGTSLEYFVDIDWWPSERTAGMILARSGDPIYVTPAFERSRALEQIRFGHDIRTWQENESPYRKIAQILKDLRISGGTLGIYERVPFFMADGIGAAASNARLVSATPVTAGCRSVKSPAELALLQIANDATLATYRAVWQALEPGMTQMDVQAMIQAAYERQGVQGFASINVGKYTAQPHGSMEPQHIAEGTVVMLDDGCKVHGYTSDITRTFVLGRATDKMKKVFAIVQKAQVAARETARTGGVMEDIDAAARKVIGDAGYGPGYKYFTHRLGHGIGMDMHEWYYAVGGDKHRIVDNMTMSDEPGIYIPGEFGVRLEDCMYATPEGGHWFTRQSPSIEHPFG
jgi:Xaa-Pro dipeptidase